MSDTGQSLCPFAVLPVSCFCHQTDADHSPPKEPLAKIFAIARIFLAFVFRPEASLCGATNARIGLR